MALEVGAVVEGKVVSIMPFGAFVSLPEGKTGLVHISEVSLDYVQNVADHLSENQEVRVKIVGIDPKGKISLSIKKVLLDERKANSSKKQNHAQSGGSVRPASVDLIVSSAPQDMSFEDMLGKFKTDSDEKMQALKRSSESKRSGGYKRSSNNYF